MLGVAYVLPEKALYLKACTSDLVHHGDAHAVRALYACGACDENGRGRSAGAYPQRL